MCVCVGGGGQVEDPPRVVVPCPARRCGGARGEAHLGGIYASDGSAYMGEFLTVRARSEAELWEAYSGHLGSSPSGLNLEELMAAMLRSMGVGGGGWACARWGRAGGGGWAGGATVSESLPS